MTIDDVIKKLNIELTYENGYGSNSSYCKENIKKYLPCHILKDIAITYVEESIDAIESDNDWSRQVPLSVKKELYELREKYNK